MTTAGGMVIRVAVRGLRIMGRVTSGVHITKLKAGDRVVDLVKVVREAEVSDE